MAGRVTMDGGGTGVGAAGEVGGGGAGCAGLDCADAGSSAVFGADAGTVIAARARRGSTLAFGRSAGVFSAGSASGARAGQPAMPPTRHFVVEIASAEAT